MLRKLKMHPHGGVLIRTSICTTTVQLPTLPPNMQTLEIRDGQDMLTYATPIISVTIAQHTMALIRTAK